MFLSESMIHPRVLIVVPGSINYFYNQLGRRVAETLRSFGSTVEVVTLAAVPDGDYDLCLVSNIYEAAVAYGNEDEAVELFEALREKVGRLFVLGMESTGTSWFGHNVEIARKVGAERILDFGIWDQTADTRGDYQDIYRFVFNGLTPSEERLVRGAPSDDGRSFPWAFIGHQVHHRATLVDFLVRAVDPGGFVYLPTLTHCAEKGSPHLNQQQFEGVLSHTRFQVWCTHHERFYMEGERFRASLLTGGVGVKVVGSLAEVPDGIPYHNLVMTAADLPIRLTADEFLILRDRFRAEALALPTLAESLSEVFTHADEEKGVHNGRPCETASL